MRLASPEIRQGCETFRQRTNPEAATSLGGVTRILLGGLDNAGKSTLACSLYAALNSAGVPTALYELDRWSDTHAAILGLKPWSERSKTEEVSIEEHAEYVERFKSDTSAVVLGDMQGRYQALHNQNLTDGADYGILITRDPIEKDFHSPHVQTAEGWEGLFKSIRVPIAIRLHSVVGDQEPPADRLGVRGLDRKLVPNHPMVKVLGGFILNNRENILLGEVI